MDPVVAGRDREGTRRAAEPVDDLRRRLYRPDATAADLQRYLAGRAAEGEEQPSSAIAAHAASAADTTDTAIAEAEADTTTTTTEAADAEADTASAAATATASADADGRTAGRFPRRRAAVGVAVVGAAALLLTLLPHRPAGTPHPGAVPRAQAVVQDVGEGQVLDTGAGTASGATPAPASIRGTAVAGQRFTGRGNAVVAVDPPPGSRGGGRAMIAMTAAGTAVRWRALLIVTRNDWTSFPVVMARGSATGLAGTPTTFVYPAGPPTRIAVQAPARARWTLVVAVADGLEPTLR